VHEGEDNPGPKNIKGDNSRENIICAEFQLDFVTNYFAYVYSWNQTY